MNLKITIILLAVLFPIGMQAKHVTVENAQSVAQKYYSNTTEGVTLRSSQPSSFSLAYTAKRETDEINTRSAQTESDDAYFYIFNAPDGKGFIIVAADDCAYPVLGYSLKGAFDYDKAPPVFMQWLKNYQKEIEEALNADSPLEANPEWQKIEDGMKLRSAGTILGTAEWHQEEPYNGQCPQIGAQRAVTGCVATAMAIVMKYHANNGFAATGTGSHSYTKNGQTYSATFGSYDYGNMPNTTSGYTNETQRNAVARLMFHCGVSVEAEYFANGPEVTNAITPYIAKALPTFFGFDSNTEYIYRSSFDDASWKSLIRTEIDNYRPIVYNGYGSAGGHAFICEGYTVSDEYAINWGWGGYCNGYFVLNALVPISGYSFSSDQGMIIGMKKGTGSTTPNQIWLTTAGGGKGMSILQNNPLTIAANALENFSYSPFTGSIAVALTDNSGNIKEVVSSQTDRSKNPLLPNYYITITSAQCYITTAIAPNDQLRMVVSNDEGATWKVILGRTGVVDFLTFGDQNVAVTGVTLNLNTRTMNEGESFQLTATVAPTNATNKNITWSTNNANVAEVNSSGFVTAKTAGTATITVTTEDGSKTATCLITVQPSTIAVTGVSLNLNARTLNEGESFQLTAIVAPTNATNKNITWSTNNANIAEVNTSGFVSAKAPGTATITVTTEDGNKTATCAITVIPASIAVTGVSLNLNTQTLNVGESFQLTATVAPTNATNKNITWSTDYANIAEVNASGIVSAKAPGTATITVTTTDGGYQASCYVTVTSPYLASGTTGALTWILSHEGTLTISGYGAMPDYSDMQSAPWQGYLSSIKSIVITNGLTKIGNYAFVNCTQITSINIPNTVTDIGSYAFYHCTNLSSLSLPNTISIIKPYTFFGCKFETLVIPSSITEIHAFAFSFCGIVSLTIPNSVTFIGIAAFSENPLTDVYVNWSIPLRLENSPFTNVNIKAATLQIPADTKSLYEVADFWMDFGVLFEEGSTGAKDLLFTPITVLLQGDILYVTSTFAEEITIYSLTGNVLYQATKPVGATILKVGALPKGILIVSSKSGWTRKIVKN